MPWSPAPAPRRNAVNLLVETVILNYMALHGEEGNFDQPAFFPRHGLGGTARARCPHDPRAGVQRNGKQPGLTLVARQDNELKGA